MRHIRVSDSFLLKWAGKKWKSSDLSIAIGSSRQSPELLAAPHDHNARDYLTGGPFAMRTPRKGVD
jgi:hypothetical protein